MSDKQSIVAALEEIGRYLELSEENRFKATAYGRAARSIESSEMDLPSLTASGSLLSLPGVGKGIAPVITELMETGRSTLLESLRAAYPPGIFELLRIPSLGIRKIALLHSELGIGTLDELEQACTDGRLRTLPGFGAKTEATICDSIAAARARHEHLLLSEAVELAERLVSILATAKAVKRVAISGTVRRRLETAAEIELVIASSDPSATIDSVATLGLGSPLRVNDHWRIDPATSTLPVLLHVVSPEAFAWTMVRSTGSSELVTAIEERAAERKLALGSIPMPENEEGDAVIFDRLSLPFLPPELREGGLPQKKTPRLIERDEIRGVFHVHTTWSDGKAPLETMLEAAELRHFEYVGISDHSKSAGYAGGLSVERLARQREEIESVAERFHSLTIFRGSEVDILADGSLDYDAATLASLDFVIASVHSRFKMDRDQMTERIVNALRNPFVTFLGHLSGRRLLKRDPYEFDPDAVFEAAAANGVIIEINGQPQRLDIDWRLMKRASDHGVIFSIHPDAHSEDALDYVRYAVWNARKGGVGPQQVFNTLAAEQVAEHLKRRRERAMKLTV